MAITIRMNQPSQGIPMRQQSGGSIPMGGDDEEERRRRQQALQVMQARQSGSISVGGGDNYFDNRLQTAMQKAREAGHTEEEVQRAALVEQVREGVRRASTQVDQTQTTKQPEKKKTGRGGFATSLISEGGATGGAVAGAAIGTAILPGVGTLIGAGLGGLAGGFGGRLTENKVRDDRWGVKEAATEGVISGATSAIPFGSLAKGSVQLVKGAGLQAAKNTVSEGVAKQAVRSAIGNTSKEKAITNQFLVRSKAADSAFQSGMEKISSDLGVKYYRGPVKTIDRTLEKAKADYNGDLSKVMDTIRGTMELDDPRKAEEVIKAIGGSNKIVRVKNGYDSPMPGYKDIKVNIRTANGSTSEVILATPEMLRAKNELGGHALYKEARTTVDSARLAELNQKQNELYSWADETASRRLTSSGPNSMPSTNALAGGYGLPVATTTPDVLIPSSSSRTMVPSTSKNLGALPNSGTGDSGVISPIVTRPNALSNVMERGSSDIAYRSFRINPGQQKNFIQKHNEDIGSYLKRMNAVGMNPNDWEGKVVQKMNAQYGDNLAKINQPISIDEYTQAVERRAQKLLDSDVPDDNAIGLNLLDTLNDVKAKRPNGWKNGNEINSTKRSFDAHVNYTMKASDPAKYTVNKHMADAVRDIIEQKNPGMRKLGLELSKAQDFGEIALQQSGLGRGSSLVRFIPAMMAGAGGAAGGIPGAVGAYAGAQFLNSRVGQTMASKGLQAGADVLAKPGIDQALSQGGKQLTARALTGGELQPTSNELPADPNQAMDQTQVSPEFQVSYGTPEDQQMVQQLVSMGITDPNSIQSALAGGGLESQLGGFDGQQASPFGFTSAQLFEAAINAMQAGDMKSSDQYIQMAEFAKSYEDSAYKQKQDAAKAGGGNGLNVTKVTAQQYGLAQSGANAVSQLKVLLQSDPGVLNRTATPGRSLPGVGGFISNAAGTGDFDAIGYNIADSILRLRTGAASNADEVRKLQSQIIPRAGDSPRTVQTKLAQIDEIFGGVLSMAQQSGGSSLEDELAAALGGFYDPNQSSMGFNY